MITERTPVPDGSAPAPLARRASIRRVVAASLATGLVAALLLAFAPFTRAEESAATGAVLCGFGLGWATLVVLSVGLTDQPQRWAVVPAVLMGTGGLLLVTFGSSVHPVLDWVWPPALLASVIWMAVRVRRQLPRRSGRALLYPVIAMLALASAGGAYATVGAAADARAYPMPGRLIDVGGHRLHLACSGTGSPTVVIEAGGGEMSSNLGWITPAVAQDTRVCAYDRAGRGWSERPDAPQDADRIAADLHTLLQRGQVPGPYVLAGHSFGGLYVLAYAHRYPAEVAGMVLVDATNPAPAAPAGSPDQPGSYDVRERVSALLSGSARLGLTRLLAQVAVVDLPARSQGEARASFASASSLGTTIDEYLHAQASAEEAAAVRSLGDTPLVVLTAGIGSSATHSAAQDHLAALSTDSSHRIVEGADHEALIGDEAAAASTTRGILDVVEAVRSRTPLGRRG